MINFGYCTKKDNIIELDDADLTLSNYLRQEYPLISTCINCGMCSAVCTAAQLTSFNLRSLRLKIDRGEKVATLSAEVAKCMHCGKCEMACPRGISNRKVAVLINKYLYGTND